MHQLIEQKKQEFSAIAYHLKKELASLRTNRANPALVDHVLVEAYGVKTPISQLAALSVPDPKTLFIQPWDKNILKDVERAIAGANLGVSPVVDGDRVRMTLPPMTEETRKQLARVLKEKLEASRNTLRRLRDHIREAIIAGEKAGGISEDDRYRAQKELDDHTHAIQEQLLSVATQKEKEIMTI